MKCGLERWMFKAAHSPWSYQAGILVAIWTTPVIGWPCRWCNLSSSICDIGTRNHDEENEINLADFDHAVTAITVYHSKLDCAGKRCVRRLDSRGRLALSARQLHRVPLESDHRAEFRQSRGLEEPHRMDAEHAGTWRAWPRTWRLDPRLSNSKLWAKDSLSPTSAAPTSHAVQA